MGRILHGLGEWLQGEYSCCSEFVIYVEKELDIDLDIDDVSAARIREPFKYDVFEYGVSNVAFSN